MMIIIMDKKRSKKDKDGTNFMRTIIICKKYDLILILIKKSFLQEQISFKRNSFFFIIRVTNLVFAMTN